jgi:hypothetical protein
MSVRVVSFTTALSLVSANALVGQEITLTARVTPSQSVQLSGQTVRFISRVSSPSLALTTLGTAVTDANGVATLKHTFTTLQSPQVFAEFVASGATALSTSPPVVLNLTKPQATITLAVSATSTAARSEVVLTARLSSSPGVSLAGHSIQFKFRPSGSTSTTVLRSALTDSNGVATHSHSFKSGESGLVIAEISSSNVFADTSSNAYVDDNDRRAAVELCC